MDSNHKTPLRRDERGRFLPAQAKPLVEMGVVTEVPESAPLFAPVKYRPLALHFSPWDSTQRTRSRIFRWALTALAASALLGVSAIQALSLDATTFESDTTFKEDFEVSCKARMTGLIFSVALNQKLSNQKLAQIHTHTLAQLTAGTANYTRIAESTMVAEACHQMWIDLSLAATEKTSQ
jgi:hypothetical protein